MNKKILKKIIKTKRFLYLSVILIIILFGVALNIAFGAFSNNKINEFINTKVSVIAHSLNINGYSGSILKIEANKEKSFELNINSLEDFDTKYEVIYEYCNDQSCSEFVDNIEGIKIYYSSLTKEKITDILPANSNKIVRLIISNNTNEAKFLKFGINSGFAHNTLTLENMITEEYEDNFLNSNIFYQYDELSNILIAEEETFNNINSDVENKLYKTIDDYGYTYYYRGTKNNISNNLIFAGMKWKIVRINGDNSIKLIYNGKCLDELCETYNEENIQSEYNLNFADNKYIGYMYGENSDSRGNSSINQIDSTIKSKLDAWYVDNLLETQYEKHLSNTSFCNDRQLQNEIGGEETGLGFGQENTSYAAKYRLDTNKTPNLKCEITNDQFIKSTDSLFIYPVGLLTADEASFAGLKYNTDNPTNYLATNYDWWTLSPYSYEDGFAKVMNISIDGQIINNNVNSILGLRPVINLNSDVKVTGTGTETDPFIII